jgi:alpha-L-glutamate ligase-like protein
MFWLFTAARRLRELGILGMNRRNAVCILDHNPRRLYPLVDDKLRMHQLCQRIRVPSPAVYAVVHSYSALRRLPELLGERGDFVIKPNKGSAGRGVLVLTGRDGDYFVRHNGEKVRLDSLKQHISDILSGMYSLGGRPDEAIVQQRIRLHPAFAALSYKGIPDVRVILYRNEPAMAMLRLPTRESNGRANLHQGGIGTGVDLDTGQSLRCQTSRYRQCAGRHARALLA